MTLPSIVTQHTTNILSNERGEAPELQLAVLAGDRVIVHPLPSPGRATVGRAASCDIAIDDGTVSRRHATLAVGDDVTIEDLGSVNGSTVRGQPIAPGRPVAIEVGEPVRIGGVLVLVQPRPRIVAAPLPVAGAAPRVGAEMRRVHDLAARVAPSPISVIILGETGVGKEVLAERIHRLSPRAGRSFLRLNCAALPETLLESELFGHEKGAFTGASLARPGLLASADGGTVFLDEVGELTLATQVKLLRVLEERAVLAIGSVRPRPIDVRFVAATNRELEAEVERGTFRADLYFRLNGIALRIPPLRERREEIEPLAVEFIAGASARLGVAVPPVLSPAARRALLDHPWPGNVRELRNLLERAVVLCAGDVIEPEHFCAGAAAALAAVPPDDPAPGGAGVAPRDALVEALARCGGNQTQAARLLGISRRTFLARLDRLGVARPRKTPAPA
jgi:two-component system, NtrC family, response regulator AtoC